MTQRTYADTHRPLHSRRLSVEALEDRRMLAVLTVNSDLDNTFSGDGFVTLREAIIAANTDATTDLGDTGSGADTIEFHESLDNGTILLALGELGITEAVTIDAASLDNGLTIDAQQNSRIFNITAMTGDFTIGGLTLTGGKTTGDNSPPDTTYSGGAIRSLTNDKLTIDQSTIISNSTVGNYAKGGGVYAKVDVTLTNSTISGNSTAGNSASGGGVFAKGDVTLTNSTISSNSTAGDHADGGGVCAFGNLTLTNSTVSGNSTLGYWAFGGGVYADRDVTLTNSTISSNNTAGDRADGGGMYSDNNVTLTNSTISGNNTWGDRADGGGVFGEGYVMLTNSTVSGNNTWGQYADGGGVFAESHITLTNSTITDNHANYSNATGGGIWVSDNDPITISGSIVAGNTAGGGNPDLRPSTVTLDVDYSLIGENAGTGLAEAPLGSPDSNGNFIGGSTHGIIDPLLGPLADNGGPTQTHALLPGSPAIDVGDPAIQQDLNQFDQRGDPFLRVADGDLLTVIAIDMGSYEAQAPPTADFDSDNDVDGTDLLAWQRGCGTTVGATRPDGNSDDDEDVDASDLAAWNVSFGDVTVPLASAQSAVSVQSSPPSQQATAPTLNLRAELIDAAIALATAGHQALPKEGAAVVEDGLSLETPYEGMFARHDPLPAASASSLGTSLSSEGDEQENRELEGVVDKAMESVFG